MVSVEGELKSSKQLRKKMPMISSSFTCSVDNAPSDVQLELIDMQSDKVLASVPHSPIFTLFSRRRTFQI